MAVPPAKRYDRFSGVPTDQFYKQRAANEETVAANECLIQWCRSYGQTKGHLIQSSIFRRDFQKP
ncbi:MAG: hypothetical protein ACNYPI_02210 [Arenicellales bacterium WSBS_2016_MAG_OTU3]